MWKLPGDWAATNRDTAKAMRSLYPNTPPVTNYGRVVTMELEYKGVRLPKGNRDDA